MLIGLFVLLKAIAYWLDRYGLIFEQMPPWLAIAMMGNEVTYARIGDFLKQRCPGYWGYVFTGNPSLGKRVGLKTIEAVQGRLTQPLRVPPTTAAFDAALDERRAVVAGGA